VSAEKKNLHFSLRSLRLCGELSMTAPSAMPVSSPRLTLSAVLMALTCAVLWGGNAVAVKITVADIPPVACAGLRFLLSLPIVAAFAWFEGISLRPARAALGVIVANGLILFVQMATFNVGTALTSASRAGVLINIHPFVVAPLAWWLLGERLRWFGILGLFLAGAGVVCLFQERLPELANASTGNAILVLSAVILGAQSIYQKFALRRIRGTVLLFWQTIVAVPLFFLTAHVWEAWVPQWPSMPALFGLAYQSIGVSGVCFIFWFILLHHYPVSQVSSIGFLVPIVAVASGMLFLGEPLTLALAGSTALVGTGIYLVTKGRMSARPTAGTTAARPALSRTTITEHP
jgi:drug/metabolite transporter (DMT)-like permease